MNAKMLFWFLVLTSTVGGVTLRAATPPVEALRATEMDATGPDHIDASFGPVSFEHFKTLPGRLTLNFDGPEFATDPAVVEIAGPESNRIEFRGFTREHRPGYAISNEYAMLGVGKEKECTASIRFARPVRSVGMAVLFATGTIEIRGFDDAGETLFSAVQNGAGDSQGNASWQDFFIGCETADPYRQLAGIEFTRSNLGDGAIPEFAIDDLSFQPGIQLDTLTPPLTVAVDFSSLGGAEAVSVAPMRPAGTPAVRVADDGVTLANQVDKTGYCYRLTPKLGLTSLTGSVNGGAAAPLGREWRLEVAGAPVETQELHSMRTDGDRVVLDYVWHSARGSLPVTVTASLSGGSLLLEFASPQSGTELAIDRPRPTGTFKIADGDNTALGGTGFLPFFGFGGDILYLPELQLFYSYQPDWTRSNSTAPVPRIVYARSRGGEVAPLRETVAITLADALTKVLPTIPNPTSPYRRTLADSVVVEFWYGHFAELGELLELYHAYGMDRVIVLVHRWQNAGFDRRYPTILPPSTARGGLETLHRAVMTARANRQRVALHENYKDFYPDSPQWNPDDLLMLADGSYQNAWADAKEMAPSKIRSYAEPVMREIRAGIGANASFLDVHSTHLPWWRVDFRPGVPGSGQMRGTLEATDDLWQMARTIYDGPVFGEGCTPTSWIHAGNIDSVMAQASSGTPLLLDFLLLKIRPLAINHGAGYFERWNSRGYQLDWQTCPLTMPEYARYSLQEVAFQTAPTIDDKIKREILPAATQYFQKRPLVGRLADAPLRAIRYYTRDGRELTVSEAVFQPKREIQRIVEEFADGSRIRLNFADEPWTVDAELTLAPLSFRAEGNDFVAETNTVDGVIFDGWSGPDSFYLNSRNYDWMMEPKGSAAQGRCFEGTAPILHNADATPVSWHGITTDTAVALTREADGTRRLRFFPQRQAGFVTIAPELLPGVTGWTALDAAGKIVSDPQDTVRFDAAGLRIDHRDDRVWSYRLQ